MSGSSERGGYGLQPSDLPTLHSPYSLLPITTWIKAPSLPSLTALLPRHILTRKICNTHPTNTYTPHQLCLTSAPNWSPYCNHSHCINTKHAVPTTYGNTFSFLHKDSLQTELGIWGGLQQSSSVSAKTFTCVTGCLVFSSPPALPKSVMGFPPNPLKQIQGGCRKHVGRTDSILQTGRSCNNKTTYLDNVLGNYSDLIMGSSLFILCCFVSLKSYRTKCAYFVPVGI